MKKASLLFFIIPQPAVNSDVRQLCLPDCTVWITNIIILAPLLVTLLLIGAVFWMLRKEGFKLGDALKENQTMDISVDNPEAARTLPDKPASNGLVEPAPAVVPPAPGNVSPFLSKTVQPKSTSRLLAFITGLVSAGLAGCICTFWLFEYMQGRTPDLDAMTNVLLVLGLGVVPYAVNKITRTNA